MKRKSGRFWWQMFLFALLFGAMLTGCWDRRELENRTSVMAMAVDRVYSPSGKALVKVSVQIPIPIKIIGAGGGVAGTGGKQAVKVVSGTGFSVGSALSNIQQRMNQELFYGHTRVIAISERIARESMEGIVDSVRRYPKMRRLLWLIITPGEAVSLLQVDPKLEQIPIVYVMDLIDNGAKSGRIPNITLGRWFIDYSSKGIEASALTIGTDHGEVRWKGLSLFQGSRLVGAIDENETWVLLQMRERQVGGDITITCPDSKGKGEENYITVHPKKVHVKKKIVPMGESFRMRLNLLVEVDVDESMCEKDFSKRDTYVKVQEALQSELKARAAKLIEDCQQKFKVDVIGMGIEARAKYLDRFEQMNWLEEFPKAKIEVNYKVKIRRSGMKLQ